MRVLVYFQPTGDAERAAEGIAERLRANGVSASLRNAGQYAGEVEPCQRVVTDDARVRTGYGARGVEVRPLTAEQAPAAGGGDPEAQDQEPPAAAEQEVAAPKRSTGRAGRRRGGK
jgi:hypothetical protein